MINRQCARLLGSALERRTPSASTSGRRYICTSRTVWNADPSPSTGQPRVEVSHPGTGPSDEVKPTASSSKPAPKSLEEARASAWYLDDEPTPPPSSSSGSRQPRFTTFDPSRTTTDSQTLPIRPLSPSAPPWLRPLHEYMTGEAGDVLEPHTVSFMPTRSSPALKPEEEEIHDRERRAGPGPLWDWVVVGVVKGTGRGVVGRADRAVRKYIRANPSLGTIEGFTNTTRKTSEKFPRIPEDSDWSLIGIPNRRLCINLFTAEGRERWDLEELWTGKSIIKPEVKWDAPRNDSPVTERRLDDGEAARTQTLW